ncbi:PREDICTED: uncharacterized protein LOC102015083, partial [Chinchilla lanigera]|uniref:uncharacterized protein LOC102015083 n=1 Tax=Chinchilla lanigera TaxID=34839 RepID=UPI000698C2F9
QHAAPAKAPTGEPLLPAAARTGPNPEPRVQTESQSTGDLPSPPGTSGLCDLLGDWPLLTCWDENCGCTAGQEGQEPAQGVPPPDLTHQPTWTDCQQLPLTLFNTEEHQWVTQAALQWLEKSALARMLNPQAYTLNQFPGEGPQGDLNSEAGLASITQHQEALLKGIKEEKDHEHEQNFRGTPGASRKPNTVLQMASRVWGPLI